MLALNQKIGLVFSGILIGAMIMALAVIIITNENNEFNEFEFKCNKYSVGNTQIPYSVPCGDEDQFCCTGNTDMNWEYQHYVSCEEWEHENGTKFRREIK